MYPRGQPTAESARPVHPALFYFSTVAGSLPELWHELARAGEYPTSPDEAQRCRLFAAEDRETIPPRADHGWRTDRRGSATDLLADLSQRHRASRPTVLDCDGAAT